MEVQNNTHSIQTLSPAFKSCNSSTTLHSFLCAASLQQLEFNFFWGAPFYYSTLLRTGQISRLVGTMEATCLDDVEQHRLDVCHDFRHAYLHSYVCCTITQRVQVPK